MRSDQVPEYSGKKASPATSKLTIHDNQRHRPGVITIIMDDMTNCIIHKKQSNGLDQTIRLNSGI
ncbi:MAG TPA: hypothetical protein VN372_00590 [Methanospirillum sp.]|nr:hypothetical protein [Methanospirillum sp.]